MQASLEISKWFLTLILFSCGLCAPAQTTEPRDSALDEAQRLNAEQRWQDLELLLKPIHQRSADMDFSLGTALARLGRWAEAKSAFEEGRKLAPRDPRFPVELAGAAFKTKHYPQAAYLLRQSIKLDPHDAYANNFLGTVYFLEGNLEATLKYWNRVDKPQIAGIEEEPEPKVAPALLDRAFTFAPTDMLKLREFLDTDARIRGMGDLFAISVGVESP